MKKQRFDASKTLPDATSIRLRAAWLYYNQGLTQREVASRLGISRTTVIRILDEALKRNEVQIWINEVPQDCVELALKLERAFGLDLAIVVPVDEQADKQNDAVGLALGRFLSETIPENGTIGVGWGRTLTASLTSFRPARRNDVKIVSLLGGIINPRQTNPVEYSWRLASLMDAECFLFLSPLIVDSGETKRLLIEKCGLNQLFTMAADLDMAVVSCGDIGATGTSLAREFVSAKTLSELLGLGCVCDVMCNFLDAEGRTVPHPVNERIMSVDLETVAAADRVVLATGGAHRAVAILATLKRLHCDTLITDESAARAILALKDA